MLDTSGAGSHRSGETGSFSRSPHPHQQPPVQSTGGGIAGAPSRFGHGPLGTIDDSNSNVMVDNASKGPRYWMDEIAFLEDRLNGGQGEIDHDDRAACEEALKAAQANLKASQQ